MNSAISPFDAYRQSAQQFFDDRGMPSSKVEEYKYSSVKNVIDDSEVFYNDQRPEGELSEKSNGVITGSLVLFAKKYRDIFTKYYNTLAASSDDAMAALNTALASGGEVIFVPKNVVVEKTFTIDLEEDINDFGRRDLFIFESGAQARIVIKHGLTPKILNRVCEVVVMEGAKVEITEDNSTHENSRKINSMYVTQEANSMFKHTAVVTQQGFCRNNIKISLKGTEADCHIYGVTVAREDAHLDNSTTIEHIAERCTSRELYKNVAGDTATAVFAGNIFVAEGAQKTEAYQKNNSILLTDDAVIHSKPQLIINADDVKCSHGATVGQLNEEALFYIRQRGISQPQAQALLLTGFVGEILEHIDDADLQETLTLKLHELCSI